ncbi:MAG: ATP-binding protein [Candidatus Margulisiibacteriota bacterium]
MPLKRNEYNNIILDSARREIGIIIGPRQVGKTTILKEIKKYCKGKRLRHNYFDLEMPLDANFFARNFDEILADIGRLRKMVLIDEFHYLLNATKLFKSIYDGYKNIKIYASGSSAIEMHKHLKESLAGRRRLYRIYPLSFKEWLPSKTQTIRLPENIEAKLSAKDHKKLHRYLNEFIVFGGMPGLTHERDTDSKKRLLLDIVATYIQKDVKALLREEDILSFNRLLTMLASLEGNLLSENSLSNDLNYSLRQVRKDLSILSQMFLLDIVKPFFSNRGRELKQVNKIYFFDSGIRNAILKDFRNLNERNDKGALLESFAFHEIQKHLKTAQDIYYWRTRQKDEVDFILVQDRTPIAVEVKSTVTKEEIPEGIKRFSAMYPECKTAVVLNNNLLSIKQYKNIKVYFLPHYYASIIPDLFSR